MESCHALFKSGIGFINSYHLLHRAFIEFAGFYQLCEFCGKRLDILFGYGYLFSCRIHAVDRLLYRSRTGSKRFCIIRRRKLFFKRRKALIKTLGAAFKSIILLSQFRSAFFQ